MKKFGIIRAIVINPLAQTVTEIQMPNDFNAMKRDQIECDTAEVVNFGCGVDAWMDECGLLKDWDEQGFTMLGGRATFAGNIVLTGRDANNDMADLPDSIQVRLVQAMVEFIPAVDARFPGSTMTTSGDDGVETTIPLGPETLTYENH